MAARLEKKTGICPLIMPDRLLFTPRNILCVIITQTVFVPVRKLSISFAASVILIQISSSKYLQTDCSFLQRDFCSLLLKDPPVREKGQKMFWDHIISVTALRSHSGRVQI